MAPTTKKWIDKKSASTFQVRYRSQLDPLIHDEEATDFVLTQVDAPNSKPSDKIKTSASLAKELGVNASDLRQNEGEAAMYGVYYDDTSYDYMQHLRDMGTTTEAVFIEAPQADTKQRKNRHDRPKKQTLDEALREQEAPKSTVIKLPKELLASETQLKRTYQDQQDVPDAITGFKPDMDPRLREVLEALDDEAYVDDDEDLFGELAKAGEASPGEFEDTFDQFEDEEDDGWQSDATEKAQVQPPATEAAKTATEEEGDDAWMREFSKFKKAQKKVPKAADDGASSVADTHSTMSFGGQSSMMSIGGTMSVSNRRRKREKKAGKAMTESSSYSMSSSALHRTEGLTLLDDRFDRIEEMYAEDEEEEELDGPVPETRQDFDSIMDDFLGSYSTTGKTSRTVRIKRGAQLTPMEQLDEVRRELGKARIR